jgi:SAM-dependent methyltransferase
VSLADASVDLVVAAQAMHWYDLDLFYRQVERVLRPGGILAAIGYAWFYVDAGIDAAIEQALLGPMRRYWAANNALLWDGYRSIPFPGEEIRIGQPAIHLDWSLDELFDYVLTWSATRALEADEGEEPLRRARAAIAEAWGDPCGKRHVVMPMQVRVARIG